MHRNPSRPASGAKLLVVDDNPTGRFVICDLLRARFPHSEVLERDTARLAFGDLRHEHIRAIVCHRARGIGDVELVRGLRAVNPAVPIVSASEPLLMGALINAGATKSIRYGAWETIGRAVAEVLGDSHPPGRTAGPVRSAAGGANRPALKVVVAHDDHRARADLCTQFAKSAGVAVHGGGEAAIDGLQLVRSVEPDLAIVDVALLDRLDLAVSLGVIGCMTQFAYFLAT